MSSSSTSSFPLALAGIPLKRRDCTYFSKLSFFPSEERPRVKREAGRGNKRKEGMLSSSERKKETTRRLSPFMASTESDADGFLMGSGFRGGASSDLRAMVRGVGARSTERSMLIIDGSDASRSRFETRVLSFLVAFPWRDNVFSGLCTSTRSRENTLALGDLGQI